MATHQCYIAMLEMDNHLRALNIVEQRVAMKPTETLKDISLDDDHPNWITYIVIQANPLICKELALFLKIIWMFSL